MAFPGTELIAGVAGGLIAVGGQLVVHWAQQRPQRKLDESRKETLKRLLDPEHMPDSCKDGWRNLSTLQRVIGADRETTTRLLVEIKARGSTGKSEAWALIRDKPLPLKKDDPTPGIEEE